MMSLAWHIEALARQKTLPDHSRLIGVPAKAQSEEAMWAAVETWVSTHNAALARAEHLANVAGAT